MEEFFTVVRLYINSDAESCQSCYLLWFVRYCCREQSDGRKKHSDKKPIVTTRVPLLTNRKRFYSDWWRLGPSSPSQSSNL